MYIYVNSSVPAKHVVPTGCTHVWSTTNDVFVNDTFTDSCDAANETPEYKSRTSKLCEFLINILTTADTVITVFYDYFVTSV